MSTEPQEPSKDPEYLACHPYVEAHHAVSEVLSRAKKKKAKAKYKKVIKHLRKAWALINDGNDNLDQIADTGGN